MSDKPMMNERCELEALVGVEHARRIEAVLGLVKQELIFAMAHFQPFNSAHEGYAVILEELDELWDEIKRKDRSEPNMRGEALQVAAMGLRFIVDLEGKYEEG